MEPPAKRKPARFLSSWTLPPGITASSKIPSFAYCQFCKDNFSVTHGGCLPCVFVSYAYEMYRNFISCACNLCIHPCFVGFGDVIFYNYLQKNVLFSGKLYIVRKFGVKKKLICTQMGDLEVGSTVIILAKVA